MERARRGEDGGRGGVSIGEWGGRVVDGRIVRNIMTLTSFLLYHYIIMTYHIHRLHLQTINRPGNPYLSRTYVLDKTEDNKN